jgi:hypothetical protein
MSSLLSLDTMPVALGSQLFHMVVDHSQDAGRNSIITPFPSRHDLGTLHRLHHLVLQDHEGAEQRRWLLPFHLPDPIGR